MEQCYINPPKTCDICDKDIKTIFYDGKTILGPWANMCKNCFKNYGQNHDIGIAYEYDKKDNQWKRSESTKKLLESFLKYGKKNKKNPSEEGQLI